MERVPILRQSSNLVDGNQLQTPRLHLRHLSEEERPLDEHRVPFLLLTVSSGEDEAFGVGIHFTPSTRF